MRGLLVFLLLLSAPAFALSSLRVGNQLITLGDKPARLKQLLGQPDARTPTEVDVLRKRIKRGRSRAAKGQPKAKGMVWEYRRDGHLSRFTVVGGKIVDIDDRHL